MKAKLNLKVSGITVSYMEDVYMTLDVSYI